MSFELIIRATEDRLHVEVPQAHFIEDTPNSMAIHRSQRKIVSIGETPQMMERAAPDRWPALHDELDFFPIFGAGEAFPDRAYLAAKYYLMTACRQIRPWAPMPLAFCDNLTCSIWLPGYEGIAPKEREAFEFAIQRDLGVNTLRMNGQAVGWSYWRRKAVYSSLWAVKATGALILTGAALAVLQALFPLALTGQTVVLILLVSVVFMMRYDSGILSAGWILAARRLVSRDLMRYTLWTSHEPNKQHVLTPLEEKLLALADQRLSE